MRSASLAGVALFALSAPHPYALAQSGGSSATADVATAKTITIHLDPDATTIRWRLKSLLHNAHGTLKLKGGEIVTNPATGVAQGEVLIDADSASSGDTSRDAKWKKEILESGTYPAIIFHPAKIEGLRSGDGTEQVKASGTMTLKGQDHPVEMTLIVKTTAKAVTVTTHFTIPYVQWGLKEASTGMMRYDKQVEVNVEAKGFLKNETAVRSAPPASDSQ